MKKNLEALKAKVKELRTHSTFVLFYAGSELQILFVDSLNAKKEMAQPYAAIFDQCCDLGEESDQLIESMDATIAAYVAGDLDLETEELNGFLSHTDDLIARILAFQEEYKPIQDTLPKGLTDDI